MKADALAKAVFDGSSIGNINTSVRTAKCEFRFRASRLKLLNIYSEVNTSLKAAASRDDIGPNHLIGVGGLPQADEPKILGVPLYSNDTLPAEKGFDRLLESDQVVFQNINGLIMDGSSELRTQRVAEYERYLRQSGYVPVRVDDDVNVYSIQCRP
jgi:hypothetical protein